MFVSPRKSNKQLIVEDNNLGVSEAVGEVFPVSKYHRCTVHFYRNVFSVVPHSKAKVVAYDLRQPLVYLTVFITDIEAQSYAIHCQYSTKTANANCLEYKNFMGNLDKSNQQA